MDIVSNIALSRLAAQQRVTEVIANNIANANTPGFKAERVQFSDWLMRQSTSGVPRGDRNIVSTQDRATWREQQAGTITHTGNTYDLALTSNGYFTVKTPNGPRLTRDGRFGLMPNGTISDGAGNALMDSNGQPIVVAQTDTRISIAGDGTVSSENGQLGKVGVVKPADPMQLTAEGNTLFRSAVAYCGGCLAWHCPGVDRGFQRPARAGDHADDGWTAPVPVHQSVHSGRRRPTAVGDRQAAVAAVA